MHFPNFADFSVRNNLRKMLTIFSFDSLSRNALRCGIDAKVRSKNEIARVLRDFFRVLIRKVGIYGQNIGVWRMKPLFILLCEKEHVDFFFRTPALLFRWTTAGLAPLRPAVT